MKYMNKKLALSKYIAVIGGCSLDRTFKQQEDGKYPLVPNVSVPGGKGANQAVAASRAGYSVKMISRLGAKDDAISKAIISNLEKNGVDMKNIEFDPAVSNDCSDIFVSAQGDNDIQRHSGAINSFTPDMVDKYADVLKNAQFVIAQMKAPKEFSEKLINFCYENNVPIVVTPCRPEKLSVSDPENLKLIDKITYITANEHECKTIFGDLPVSECVARYPNKLIVTLGADGAIFHNGERLVKLNSLDVERVVDTTGAGDTLNGNFVVGLLEGLSVEQAIRRGMAASTIKIQSQTAQAGMPTKQQLDGFIAERGLEM